MLFQSRNLDLRPSVLNIPRIVSKKGFYVEKRATREQNVFMPLPFHSKDCTTINLGIFKWSAFFGWYAFVFLSCWHFVAPKPFQMSLNMKKSGMLRVVFYILFAFYTIILDGISHIFKRTVPHKQIVISVFTASIKCILIVLCLIHACQQIYKLPGEKMGISAF